VQMHRSFRLGCTALLATAAGCTGWSRLDHGRPLPVGGTVQVWSDGRDILLRNPKVVGDSLVGQEPPPGTARRTFPLATIDSLRIQDTDMGKAVLITTGVALAVLVLYAQGAPGMQ
jgi:hypothetical protein